MQKSGLIKLKGKYVAFKASVIRKVANFLFREFKNRRSICISEFCPTVQGEEEFEKLDAEVGKRLGVTRDECAYDLPFSLLVDAAAEQLKQQGLVTLTSLDRRMFVWSDERDYSIELTDQGRRTLEENRDFQIHDVYL